MFWLRFIRLPFVVTLIVGGFATIIPDTASGLALWLWIGALAPATLAALAIEGIGLHRSWPKERQS